MSLTGPSPLSIDANGRTVEQGYRHGPISGSAIVATAGTRVQLSATSQEAKRLDITAGTSNTGWIVIGGSGVVALAGSQKGVPIAAGNTYTLTVTDLSNIWIDAQVNGEGVTYNYFY